MMAVTACGDSGSSTTETTATATATAPSTGETGTTTTATTGATEPTTGATTDNTTGVTSGVTSGMTSGVTSGETSGETATTTATTSATGGGESGTAGTTTSETTGNGEVLPCVTDQDCTLVESCCDCESLNPGETVPECGLPECAATACGAVGLFAPVVECRFGRCMFAKQTCNPFGVTCEAAAPDCGPDAVPTVEDTNEGKCWTGNCVPAGVCDWVPDCSYCDDPELVCVGKLQKGAYKVCEAKPFECSDVDNLDCACGQQICDASPPHTVCHDAADDIACECPFC